MGNRCESDNVMLIGLNGFKRVGKDTVAEYLEAQYDFERMAFADYLKNGVAALLDISREDVDRYKELDASVVVMGKSMSFRVFLQRFGTEMARKTWNEDFWVDLLMPKETLTSLWHYNKKVVVSDARFENELSRIHHFGGYNIKIIRPGFVGDGHASEVEPPEHLIDYSIINSETFEYLGELVDYVIDDIVKVEEHAGR